MKDKGGGFGMACEKYWQHMQYLLDGWLPPPPTMNIKYPEA